MCTPSICLVTHDGRLAIELLLSNRHINITPIIKMKAHDIDEKIFSSNSFCCGIKYVDFSFWTKGFV